MATCRLSGYLPSAWLPAAQVATCRARGYLPRKWLPAKHVATCRARGYLPHGPVSAPSSKVVLRWSSSLHEASAVGTPSRACARDTVAVSRAWRERWTCVDAGRCAWPVCLASVLVLVDAQGRLRQARKEGSVWACAHAYGGYRWTCGMQSHAASTSACTSRAGVILILVPLLPSHTRSINRAINVYFGIYTMVVP